VSDLIIVKTSLTPFLVYFLGPVPLKINLTPFMTPFIDYSPRPDRACWIAATSVALGCAPESP
jgi:hypothetical protein